MFETNTIQLLGSLPTDVKLQKHLRNDAISKTKTNPWMYVTL